MNEKGEVTGKLMRSAKSRKYEVMEKINDVKEMIKRHVNSIHSSVATNTKETIRFLNVVQQHNGNLTNVKPKGIKNAEQNPRVAGIINIWRKLSPPTPTPTYIPNPSRDQIDLVLPIVNVKPVNLTAKEVFCYDVL